ncbi:NADPH-dependent FMN reductase [Kitasatospora kifunensis]|uniref:NAD(P)H-dependent FMN reductase n=1 Tax=Kitasatospora kifunensis TaxID=58351 RepID=A0A7W7QWT7_KITKI|nr:NADPH-dependent FMN reductase [Kitasatospora kifunensis]MBB4921189.1 NAD(P)H-dependent FMN reductase [Kitasatospora kifunensis]
MNLLLIAGTTAELSSCRRLTALIGERAALTGERAASIGERTGRTGRVTTGELDRSLLALPVLDPDRYADGRLHQAPAVAHLCKEVAAADALVLVTPVQHGSFSGALKNTLDHLPDAALADRPVLLASTASSLHNAAGACDHLRAVVRALGGWAVPTHLVAQRADLTEPAALAALTARIDQAVGELLRLGTALAPACGR